MLSRNHNVAPACLYILADHLDSVLAAGEDLVKAGSYWPDGDSTEPAVSCAQRWAAKRLRTHELKILTHILQARHNAKLLGQDAPTFRALAHLFWSGLHDMEELGAQIVGEEIGAFDSGNDVVVFLRERGLIAADAPGSLPSGPLPIGDSYLVGGRMPLGLVLDYASEFLDHLDAHFGLYPENDTAANANGHGADDVGNAA